MSARLRVVRVAVFALLLAGLAAPLAKANLLTSILRDSAEVAGETSGRVASATAKLGPLAKAAVFLEELTAAPKGALAAHATPEGHWEFVNRDGQTFTVGTKDEMTRVLPTLAPDAVTSGQTKLTLYLSEDSVFSNRDALDQIPADADLFVVTDGGAVPVARAGKGADLVLTARPKPHLAMELDVQALFDETSFLLARPLNKSSIRTIALEPGASKWLSSAPKLDPDTKVPLVDQLDPESFADGLRGIRGQTALVTGRVADGRLYITPSSGSEVALSLDEIGSAARDNDVNLVILHSDSGRQAGGRNWLWQKIEVGGLNAAAETATFGDFLDALAARRGGFALTTSRDSTGRVHVRAEPDAASIGVTSDAANAFDDLVSHVTGEVITNAADVDTRDQSAETELDTRLIPGIPTYIQYPYLGALLAGLLGWPTARGWWLKLRARLSGNSASGPTGIGRVASEAAFALIFLPIVGGPAFAVQVVHQTVEAIMAPFRWMRRRFLTSKV